MTVKLAEAIVEIEKYQEWRRGVIEEYPVAPQTIGIYIDTVIEAARAYHELPVVDIEKLYGRHEALEMLRATYPDGVRFK